MTKQQKTDKKIKPSKVSKTEITVSFLSVLTVIAIWYVLTNSIVEKLYFPSPKDSVPKLIDEDDLRKDVNVISNGNNGVMGKLKKWTVRNF